MRHAVTEVFNVGAENLATCEIRLRTSTPSLNRTNLEPLSFGREGSPPFLALANGRMTCRARAFMAEISKALNREEETRFATFAASRVTSAALCCLRVKRVLIFPA